MKGIWLLIGLAPVIWGWCAPLDAAAQGRTLKRAVDRGVPGAGAPSIDQRPTSPNAGKSLRSPADTTGRHGARKDNSKNEGDGQSDEPAEPRLLETYLFHDTLKRQRIFTWQHSRYLNIPQIIPMDTAINDRFRDYPFLQRDVGVTYLGTVGSAVMLHNYFKRQTSESFYYLSPYMEYAITPDNIRFYNTKQAFTRFEYSGTLFGNSMFEEGNVEMFVTANLLPQWNWSIRYRHLGTRGQLTNEATDNNVVTLATSYSGKRYSAHAGFIYNGWNNKENGGVTDDFFVRDTVIDARVIDVSLASATTKISNYSFFITQSYRAPLQLFRRDTTAGRDTSGREAAGKDTTVHADEGMVVYLGHSAEYTTLSRSYNDKIEQTDSVGRSYYGERFFIHPDRTRDSMSIRMFDNKLFFSFQPWAVDAIVSKVSGGAGFRHLSHYAFAPLSYLQPVKNQALNNFYLYGAASGLLQRYFRWSAFARYDLTGEFHTQHDFLLTGEAGCSVYPIKDGVHLTARLLFQLKQPDYFLQQTYGNHFQWTNSFDKTQEVRAGLTLAIPGWKLEATFDYSLLSNGVFFNRDALPEQEKGTIHVLAGTLKKNFKAGPAHFDHRILLQTTFNDNAGLLPLPLLSANVTWYLQGVLVKNVLTVQIGLDAYFHTRYRAYAYNPATGAFHAQNDVYIGDYPYVDAFLNMKWKRATIFAKMINCAESALPREYFSAPHYIRPQTTLKLGISWFLF